METLVSQRKSSSHASDSTAYDHRSRGNSYSICSERFEETCLCDCHLHNMYCLLCSIFLLSHVTPGALFADVGKIKQIFVQPGITNCFLEERLVCPGSAGRYNYSIKIHFLDNFLEHFLAVL